jgi:hypothetical protein
MSRKSRSIALQIEVPPGIDLDGLRRACDGHGYPAALTWKGKGWIAALPGPETSKEGLRAFVRGWVAGQGY